MEVLSVLMTCAIVSRSFYIVASCVSGVKKGKDVIVGTSEVLLVGFVFNWFSGGISVMIGTWGEGGRKLDRELRGKPFWRDFVSDDRLEGHQIC